MFYHVHDLFNFVILRRLYKVCVCCDLSINMFFSTKEISLNQEDDRWGSTILPCNRPPTTFPIIYCLLDAVASILNAWIMGLDTGLRSVLRATGVIYSFLKTNTPASAHFGGCINSGEAKPMHQGVCQLDSLHTIHKI